MLHEPNNPPSFLTVLHWSWLKLLLGCSLHFLLNLSFYETSFMSTFHLKMLKEKNLIIKLKSEWETALYAAKIRVRSSQANCAPAGGIGSKVKWLISWPLLLLLFFTVPNCAKPRWEKYFMVSFLLSTVWIAVFSYLMVWMVSMKCIWQGFLLRLNSSLIAPPQNERTHKPPVSFAWLWCRMNIFL